MTSSQAARPSIADPVRSRRSARSVLLDVVVVLGFVAIGRRSHDEGSVLAGTAGTAWPFLAGLMVGWVALLALRLEPESNRAGAVLVASTVAVGMPLRHLVAGEGTPPSFVVVATTVLTVFLLGRRAVGRFVARRAAAG